MGVDDVLRRVEEDLARGHTFVAIQRLTTLVQANPKDLGLRARLAEVHLATGNFVEAGRWSYLSEGGDGRATAAFEKAYRHPHARAAALRWTLDPDNDPPHVQAVLTPLQREAERAAKKAASGIDFSLSGSVFVVLAFLGFFVLGLVTFVRWLWPG